jgi:predicted metalloprotease
MRWEGQRESSNVDDIRGAGGGRGGMRMGGKAGLGCGGVIIVLVISWITGVDPRQLLQVASQTTSQVPSTTQAGPVAGGGQPTDQAGKFASVVLASTEEVWGAIFQASGQRYEPPRMVLFSDSVDSACGMTSSAVGPFYCPGDSKVYLDLSFFDELSQRFGAPGDFAAAYVIAHEVGHHVQNLLGYSAKADQLQQRARSDEEANQISVRVELMADCLAGVWAFHANQQRHWLEAGDVEEGINAAQSIGDDRLQKMGTGRVQPESWTHGSSAQRTAWLGKGLESGNPDVCDTFAAR